MLDFINILNELRLPYTVTIVRFYFIFTAQMALEHLEVLYGWKCFLYSARTHWLLGGHMPSNNEAVSRQLFLGNGYQPQTSASADNPYLDLNYSGYHKNLIQ